MPLLGNTKHTVSKSLQEIYFELLKDTNDTVSLKIGNDMLAFIEMINKTFLQTEIWGLTSHYRLVLQTKDDWKSEWFVIVGCIGSNEYYFEYLMPNDKSPWDNAMVKGIAYSLTEAKKYLVIAMSECGGWKENPELKQLLLEIKS